MRIVVLCFWAFWCLGCESDGLFIGLARKPEQFRLELTGLSIPLVIGIVLAAWFIGGAMGRRRDK